MRPRLDNLQTAPNMKLSMCRKSAKSSCTNSKNPHSSRKAAPSMAVLDWERRYQLMKSHTVTHLINGAARTSLRRTRLAIRHPERP